MKRWLFIGLAACALIAAPLGLRLDGKTVSWLDGHGRLSPQIVSLAVNAACAFPGSTGGFPCGGSSTTTVWSATNKSTAITLSGANLVATDNTSGASAIVRSSVSTAAGKLYAEFTVTRTVSNGYEIGVMNANETSFGVFLGHDTNSESYQDDGAVTFNSASQGTFPTFTTGDRIDMALDMPHQKVWYRKNGGNWNNDVIANQNPATNTGGLATPVGPLFAAFRGNDLNDAITVNFGSSAFVDAVPNGFTAWP